MRRIALVLALAGVLAGCGDDGPSGPALVVYGNSYADYPWVESAARDLDLRPVRRGVGGAESATISERVRGDRLPEDATVLVWASLNDLRRFGTERAGLDSYRQSLRLMLRRIRAQSPQKVAVVTDPPLRDWARYPPYDHGSQDAVDAYADVSRDEARRAGALIIGPPAAWNPATDILADGVHPSKAGDGKIAAQVVRGLRD